MLPLGVVTDPPWKVLRLHTDHLGSVRAITNSSGALVSVHNYFPFGGEISPMFSHNTHQYTGHERDRETGLDYMLARYYGDSLPRFLSPDPIGGSPGRPQSWNRYAYVLGNPIKLVDPSGMYWAPGTPMPILPGDPNGCTMCIKVKAGEGVSEEEAKNLENGAHSYYTKHRVRLEKFYSAFGIKPTTLEEWFTPGRGPRVTLRRNMKDDGSWDMFRGVLVNADSNTDVASQFSSVVHELTHRMQAFHLRFNPSRDLDFPDDLAVETREDMLSRHVEPRGIHFWPYAIEAYLREGGL